MYRTASRIDSMLRYVYVNEVIFLALLVVSFVGDILGELGARATVSDRVVMFYWLLTTPLFFCASVASEKSRRLRIGRPNLSHGFVRLELTHWGSAFAAILLVMLLLHAEYLNPHAAGLVIHIILAHTMFVTGTRQGARFYLIGAFLFVTAALTVIMEGITGMLLAIAVTLGIAGLYVEEHYLFPALEKKDQGQD